MTIIRVIEITCAELGSEIAVFDAHQQAEFFRAFLNECKSWGPERYRHQFKQIRSRLNKEQLATLKVLSQ